MAIQLLQENPDGTVLIDKDGTKSVIPMALYEQLLVQEGGTDQASTHNLPSLTPAAPAAPSQRPPALSLDVPNVNPDELPSADTAAELVDLTTPNTPPDIGPPDVVSGAAPSTPAPVTVTPTPDVVSGAGAFTPPSVVSGTPAPPVSDKSITRQEYNKSIREGVVTQEGINQQVTDLDREDAAKILALKEAEDVSASELEAKRQKERLDEQAERQALYESKKQAVADFQNTEIKEGDWYTKSTTVQLIMAGIGNLAALRGSGSTQGKSGYTRAKMNTGLGIITDAIDRDLKIQAANLEKKGKTISQQGGLIANYKQLGDDNEAAFAKATATAKESVARKIALVGEQSKDPRIKIAMEQASAELNKQADAALMKNAAAETTEKITERETRDKERRTGIAGGHLRLAKDKFKYQQEQDELDRQAKKNAAAAESKYFDTSMVVGAVDSQGNALRVKDAKDRNNIRDITGTTQEIINSARKVSYLLTKEGRQAYGFDKDQAQAEAARISLAMMETIKGVPSDADAERVMKAIGFNTDDPLAWISMTKTETREKNINALITTTKRIANTRLKNTTGSEDIRFEEFNPIDLSTKSRPPEAQAGLEDIIGELQKEKATRESGKGFTDTPEAKKKQLKSKTARNEKIVKSVKDTWSEVDKAYDTDKGIEVAIRGAKAFEALVREMDPNSFEYKYILTEIKSLKDYAADPTSRRKDIGRKKKKEEENKRRALKRMQRSARGKQRLPENDPLP